MANQLIDLNDHLFAQLERLSNDDLTPEQLSHEMDRSKGIVAVSREIITNARLTLDAQVALQENKIKSPPLMLGVKYDQ